MTTEVDTQQSEPIRGLAVYAPEMSPEEMEDLETLLRQPAPEAIEEILREGEPRELLVAHFAQQVSLGLDDESERYAQVAVAAIQKFTFKTIDGESGEVDGGLFLMAGAVVKAAKLKEVAKRDWFWNRAKTLDQAGTLTRLAVGLWIAELVDDNGVYAAELVIAATALCMADKPVGSFLQTKLREWGQACPAGPDASSFISKFVVGDAQRGAKAREELLSILANLDAVLSRSWSQPEGTAGAIPMTDSPAGPPADAPAADRVESDAERLIARVLHTCAWSPQSGLALALRLLFPAPTNDEDDALEEVVRADDSPNDARHLLVRLVTRTIDQRSGNQRGAAVLALMCLVIGYYGSSGKKLRSLTPAQLAGVPNDVLDLREAFLQQVVACRESGDAPKQADEEALKQRLGILLEQLAESENSEPEPAEQPVDPTTISSGPTGSLELHSPIGRGGVAEVWAGHDGVRPVAVKLFLGEDGAETNTLALRHARALAKCDHPNVVPVYYLSTTTHPTTGRRVHCMVTELIEGQTLSGWLRARSGQPLELSELRRLGCGILDGLSHIHERGATHGDLHGDNVMVTEDVVKIIDLYSSGSLALLSTGPRELRGQTDVHHVGALCHELLLAAGLSKSTVADFGRAIWGYKAGLEDVRVAFERASQESPPETVPVAPSPAEDSQGSVGSDDLPADAVHVLHAMAFTNGLKGHFRVRPSSREFGQYGLWLGGLTFEIDEARVMARIVDAIHVLEDEGLLRIHAHEEDIPSRGQLTGAGWTRSDSIAAVSGYWWAESSRNEATSPTLAHEPADRCTPLSAGVPDWPSHWSLPEFRGPLAGHDLRDYMLKMLEERISSCVTTADNETGAALDAARAEARVLATVVRPLCHQIADALERALDGKAPWPYSGGIHRSMDDARLQQLRNSMPARWRMSNGPPLAIDDLWPLLQPRFRLREFARWLEQGCPDDEVERARVFARVHLEALGPAESAVAHLGIPIERIRDAREGALTLVEEQAPLADVGRKAGALCAAWEAMRDRLIGLKPAQARKA